MKSSVSFLPAHPVVMFHGGVLRATYTAYTTIFATKIGLRVEAQFEPLTKGLERILSLNIFDAAGAEVTDMLTEDQVDELLGQRPDTDDGEAA